MTNQIEPKIAELDYIEDEDVFTNQVFTNGSGSLVVEDFVRNFLVQNGLTETFNTFQLEWYTKNLTESLTNMEDSQRNVAGISEQDSNLLLQNQRLQSQNKRLKEELQRKIEELADSQTSQLKYLKERDFFKLNYTRLQQEIKRFHDLEQKERLRSEESSKELTRLTKEVQKVSKEKMLAQIDRDKLSNKIETLETALKSIKLQKVKPINDENKEEVAPAPDPKELPTARSSYTLRHSFVAHSQAVSSIKFHPHKMILATVSDDRHWKMWAFPTSELLTSGYGHFDWLSDCDFNSDGSLFSTCSGDSTVRIWRLGYQSAQNETLKPLHIFKEHSQAVWSTEFGSSNSSTTNPDDLLLTASMDHLAKLWDIETGKCKVTLRGHADSVNFATFGCKAESFNGGPQFVITCSGDKTISYWDIRTGICTHTLIGHTTSINHIDVSSKGLLASVDASGNIKIWDIRNIQEIFGITYAEYGLPGKKYLTNRIKFDPNGSNLLHGSYDGYVRLTDIKENKTRSLGMHCDSGVQAVLFDENAGYAVSAGTDGTGTRVGLAMVKMKKKTSPTQAVGYKPASAGAKGKGKKKIEVDADINQVVFPQERSTTLSHEQNEKIGFIERTMGKYRKERYKEKVQQMEGIYRNMQKAMIELEKADVELFKKASIKQEGIYFPMNRRILVDTPPVAEMWKTSK